MEEVKDFHDMYNKNITILLSANRLYRTKQKVQGKGGITK